MVSLRIIVRRPEEPPDLVSAPYLTVGCLGSGLFQLSFGFAGRIDDLTLSLVVYRLGRRGSRAMRLALGELQSTQVDTG